jgi:voltage-gated potassium channel
MFQSLRLARLVRLVRLARIVFRARRIKGKGAQLVRALGVVGSLASAGALALRIVEPSATHGFYEALWWSVVTMSTVGYGDIAPATTDGRVVAMCLMVAGVGLFGFMAGFVSSLMEDDEEDEILSTVKRIEARLASLQQGP